VALRASPPEGIRFKPAEFELEAAATTTVLIVWQPSASQAEHLRDWLQTSRRQPAGRAPAAGRAEYLLEWRLGGARGGFIPLEVTTVGGLARAVASRLRRVAADHGLSARGQGPEEAG
jgi:hypothetical protein